VDAGGRGEEGREEAEGDVRVPAPADWVDGGEILAAGAEGTWDRQLAGGFAASALIRDGVVYLYYQGAEGYDDVAETVTYRSIGLATSSDGVTFVKHAGNPVISWRPSGDVEEGAASGAALMTPAGGVGILYGANTHTGGVQVTADGRYAEAADGRTFEDRGVALDASSFDLWGGGDEIFPVAAFTHDGRWVSYYIPNGVPERGQLGVAQGPDPLSLGESAPVRSAGRVVEAWGPAAVVRLGEERYAVFVTVLDDLHGSARHIDAYEMDPADPAELSALEASYVFADMSAGTLLLDEVAERWYLIYRDADAATYRIRTAPVRRRLVS